MKGALPIGREKLDNRGTIDLHRGPKTVRQQPQGGRTSDFSSLATSVAVPGDGRKSQRRVSTNGKRSMLLRSADVLHARVRRLKVLLVSNDVPPMKSVKSWNDGRTP